MFQDISTLAEVTRLTEKLLYFLSKENAEGRYVSFKIKKKDGNLREINAPCASLKIMQRWILQNILYKVRVSQYSIGFIKNGKGSPLVLCAERHKNNLYILKMDLKDFYPSICRAKVYNQFLQLGYNTYAANLITNICIFIMGPLSRPLPKILRVPSDRTVLSSEAPKVELIRNLIA